MQSLPTTLSSVALHQATADDQTKPAGSPAPIKTMHPPRLLLVNPIHYLQGRRQRGWSGNRFLPPLSLGYVAALTPQDWRIRIVDENAGQDATHIRDFTPDLVGITSYTATVPRAYHLAAHFRALGTPVVIGGCHATAMPAETIQYADAAFVGQAEGAWPRLVQDFLNGQLGSVYDGGSPPLDNLPLPRRDLYPKRYVFDSVLTSKGCPNRCEFCSVWKMYGARYLTRPVPEVVDELEQIRSRHLFFVDDNVTANPARATELFSEMTRRGLRKRFAIQASLEVGQDVRLLRSLRRAGCFLILVGIESLDEETLQKLRKSSNLKVGVKHFGDAISRIHEHGMAVSASIIFGNDGDTPETFRSVESFVNKAGIDSPVYTILTPLPGTDLWDRLQAQSRVRPFHLPDDYAYFDTHHVTFEPRAISAEALLEANRQAVRRATSRGRLLRSIWSTWRRTGSVVSSLASFQNSRWMRLDARL